MDITVTTEQTLYRLVDLDTKVHKVKDLAVLFLKAMNDWPPFKNQDEIAGFVTELKNYFGSPLTVKNIANQIKALTEFNSWRDESGCYIEEMIEMSTAFCGESDFDKILMNILTYYGEEFSKVDFTAELKYRTTEEGGRKTPAHSGYRPQVKVDFTEMQTSGQQTFIDQEIVLPGETVKAKIKLLSPDFFVNSLTEGMTFEFREGSTVMGTGQILEIINDKLEK
ncbi:MAG TPA: hypothetical protein VE978_17170 [Chitinophagales bacterium]|nr:hypothetical protein [Chitinophagales bacterium]